VTTACRARLCGWLPKCVLTQGAVGARTCSDCTMPCSNCTLSLLPGPGRFVKAGAYCVLLIAPRQTSREVANQQGDTGPRRGPDERDPVGDNHPNMSATDLLVHILAHLPNLEGASCGAERSTFANARRP